MLNKIKELVSLVVGSRLSVTGTGRTFAEAPMWLAVIAALTSPHLAVVTALLMAMRLIVSSPSKKVADLPAAYVLAATLMAPWVCAAALVLGFLFRYGARFEKDATRM